MLWRKQVENKPEYWPSRSNRLLKQGADLPVVMGYRYPGSESRAVFAQTHR